MGLQKRTDSGIQTKDQQPRQRGPLGFGQVGGENHPALPEWASHGGDTADTAGILNDRFLLFFLRQSSPDWAEEKEGLCASAGSLKFFSILLKTLSFYPMSVQLLNKQFLSHSLFLPVSGIQSSL